MLELPMRWYRECMASHSVCAPPDPTFRPTRLIEINNENSVKLVITKNEDVHEPYVAFSHCWGKAKTLKLIQENLLQLQSWFSDSELPTSYKEALLVCRSMGFRYIWIDSLCIIQDSSEDWQDEALVMKDVYRNSTMNLCATAAAENSGASFQSRDISLVAPLVLNDWMNDGDRTRRWCINNIQDMLNREIRESPLVSRAWVFQEQYLSRKILHMADSQFWWKCREKLACETHPAGFPDPFGSLISPEISADSRNSVRSELLRDMNWYKLGEEYTYCNLTFATDKLVAFAGVAQNKRREFGGDQYVAGMWRSQMPLALCWKRDDRRCYRTKEYTAPTWSWASMVGAIEVPLIHSDICLEGGRGSNMKLPIEIHCDVIDIRIDLKDSRYDTGQMSSGQLDLNAHLIGPVDFDAESTAEGIIKLSCTGRSSVALEIPTKWGEDAYENIIADEVRRDGSSWLTSFSDTSDEEQPAPTNDAEVSDNRGIAEHGEAEKAKTPDLQDSNDDLTPAFLVPVARFSVHEIPEWCVDNPWLIGKDPYTPADIGIVVLREQCRNGFKYYRTGYFSHLCIPDKVLEAFPRQTITIH
jgi:hypothetical protein